MSWQHGCAVQAPGFLCGIWMFSSSTVTSVCSHGLNGDPVFGYVSERLVDLIYCISSTVNGNVSVQFDLKSFCFNLTCNWLRNQHLKPFHTSRNLIIRSRSPVRMVIGWPTDAGSWIEQRLLRWTQRTRYGIPQPSFFNNHLNSTYWLKINKAWA